MIMSKLTDVYFRHIWEKKCSIDTSTDSIYAVSYASLYKLKGEQTALFI